MKTWNILIAIPSYDRKLYVETATSITNTIVTLLQEKAQAAIFSFSGCAVISHARNAIVAEFLARKDKSHLLFVDADMEWSPHTILRLLRADVPFAAAPYVSKNYDYPLPEGNLPKNLDTFHAATVNWNVVFDNPAIITGQEKLAVRRGFAKASRIGAGLMLLRRDCLESMVRKYAETEYRWDALKDNLTTPNLKYHGLFDLAKDEHNNILGEDYAFCDRWTRGCGGEIWCDVDARVAHHGHHRYSGSLQESLQLRGKSAKV
ncbi:hypothetical protein ACMDCR_10400 [Labrys okinawensis]|uniref:hypothetical protein n=1 Tax=Labrys okinawensis TaxID=346911 RepID=UPI0039BD7AA0